MELQISEIFLSIQGESTWTGLPCTFVRLTGCPLRCTYCDTAYAFHGGQPMTVAEVIAEVEARGCKLVEVTGGEPLAQPRSLDLMRALLERGYTVLLETSGSLSIAGVPHEVRKIVDLKCPSSGESSRNDFGNLGLLAPHDEVKCVIGTREDYEWARDIVSEHAVTTRCQAVLFSPVFGALDPADLIRWILDDGLFEVRFQLQAHKCVWAPDARGV